MKVKVERNDPCPCGSGKKYKKCCGFSGKSFFKPPNPKTISTNLSEAGLPGQEQLFISVPIFKNGREANPLGEAGDYEAVFLLCRPWKRCRGELNSAWPGSIDGNSHLKISKPAYSPPNNPDADQILIRAQVNNVRITFRGVANKDGYLSKIISEPFYASNFDDAQEKAYHLLIPSLSLWSANFDIPMIVESIGIIDKKTGASRFNWTAPYYEVPLVLAGDGSVDVECRGYFSLYREALTSNSEAYQFLCFYKIIESIRERRSRLNKEAKAKGAPIRRPEEKIPSEAEDFNGWLNSIYYFRPEKWDPLSVDSIFRDEVKGKKFNSVIDDLFRPIRVDIAHALFAETGELQQSVDNYPHITKVHRWLPLIKCIVRHMLKHEFPKSFLSGLDEKGNWSR